MAADSPVIIRLGEHQTITTDQLSPTHARWLAEHHAQHVTVQPAWEPGHVTLAAGAHIGTIVVGDVRLQIEPKVPIDNLFFMLSYAYDLPVFRDQQAPLGQSEDLFDFVVRIFVRQVDAIVRQGIQRGYIDFDEDHRYLRGRLQLAEHLRREVVRPGLFHQRTNEFTADLLENRILRATLERLTQISYRNGNDLRRGIRRTLAAFSEVAYAPIRPADCDQVIYTRLNERYRSPVNLARLLLLHLSLESHAGETPFATYLLPMYDVFERFVARYLAEAFAGRPRFGVVSQERLWLDSAHSYPGIPDIVLRYDGRPFAVLDTKYKVYGDKPNQVDVYQMFTYARTLGVDRAVLIYPDDGHANPLVMKDGVTIAMQPLSLSGTLPEFRARCAAFAGRLLTEAAVNASL